MSDFLVSPPRETSWRMAPDDFAARMQDRWPDADVRILSEPDAWAALRFEVQPGDSMPTVDGHLAHDGQVVGLDGDVPETAAIAAWLREIVPEEQELIYWDQGYEVDVPLTEGITPDDIVAAVEAAQS